MAFRFPATFTSPPSSVTFEHERVMDPACLRHTELPGTSKLFADFSYHFDRVARFAQPGTVAVLTGQQVGLFSGPAYTIYKALTAARLSEDLNKRGIPAVP